MKKTTKAISYTIILLIFAGMAVGSQFMKPHNTKVLEADPSLSYSVGDTVPTMPWLVIFIVVPTCIMLIAFACTEKKTQLNTLKIFYFILLAFCLTEGITSVMKNVTGRPRPCFFERCGYPSTTIDGGRVFGIPGKYVDKNKCTASGSLIRDAYRSYPSGHSSHTMVDATFTFLLLVRILRSIKGLKKQIRRIIEIVGFVVCMSLPAYVGSSRIWDYKHRGEDVIAGYIVGALSALIAYYFVFGWNFDRNKTVIVPPTKITPVMSVNV